MPSYDIKGKVVNPFVDLAKIRANMWYWENNFRHSCVEYFAEQFLQTKLNRICSFYKIKELNRLAQKFSLFGNVWYLSIIRRPLHWLQLLKLSLTINHWGIKYITWSYSCHKVCAILEPQDVIDKGGRWSITL